MNEPRAQPVPPPTPRPILGIGLIGAIALLLGSSAGLFIVVRDGAWLSLGFEAALLVSGVIGALAGIGRFRSSHALTFLCIGGASFVCGVMSFVASGQAPGDLRGLVRALLTDPLVASRLALAALFLALSGLVLLLRRPRASGKRLLWAAALGAAPAAAAVAMLIGPVRQAFAGLPPLVIATAVFFGFFVLGGLLSVSLHCLIRAFEVGQAQRLDEEESSMSGDAEGADRSPGQAA
jgi:hypothetical protein